MYTLCFFHVFLLSRDSCYSVALLRFLSDYMELLKPLHMTGLTVDPTSALCRTRFHSVPSSRAVNSNNLLLLAQMSGLII